MPFNSAGIYTPPSGATTAAPGDLIRSSIWNSIFTDISSALSTLGLQLYGKNPVTSTPYTPVSNDSFLTVNVAGASTINLPTAASRNGFPLAIKDSSGNASTNKITIVPNGAETIDGLTGTAFKIDVDWGGYTLVPVTGGWLVKL